MASVLNAPQPRSSVMVCVTTMIIAIYVTSCCQIATLTATKAVTCSLRVTPVETGLMRMVTMRPVVWANPDRRPSSNPPACT